MHWNASSAGPDPICESERPRVRHVLDGGSELMHRHGQRTVSLLTALALFLGSTGPLAPDTAARGATPAADCPATTPDDNLAIVRGFYEEGVNGADLSVFDRVAAPDIVYYGATVGDESGLEALKRIYGEALTGFP